MVKGKLVNFTPLQQKMDYLSGTYPGLYIFILEFFQMKYKKKQYAIMCKSYEEDPYKYSLYVHGYFLVWLD